MCGSFGSHGQEVFEWTGKGFLHLPLTAQTCFHCRTTKGKGHRGEERVTKSQFQTSPSKYFYGTGVAVTDMADINLSDNLHKYSKRYKQLLQLLDQFTNSLFNHVQEAEEAESPKRNIRDSGYIDCWDSERSDSLSPPRHCREDSFDSLDSFGSRSRQTPSPDVPVTRGSSDGRKRGILCVRFTCSLAVLLACPARIYNRDEG